MRDVKMVVEGNQISVRGKTYSVREILKKHGFRWDRYSKEWYGATEQYTADEIREIAKEINADLEVHSLEEIPADIAEWIPDRAKEIIRELLREE